MRCIVEYCKTSSNCSIVRTAAVKIKLSVLFVLAVLSTLFLIFAVLAVLSTLLSISIGLTVLSIFFSVSSFSSSCAHACLRSSLSIFTGRNDLLSVSMVSCSILKNVSPILQNRFSISVLVSGCFCAG